MGLRKRHRDNSSSESNSLDSEVLKKGRTHNHSKSISKKHKKCDYNESSSDDTSVSRSPQRRPQPKRTKFSDYDDYYEEKSRKKIVTIIIPVLYQRSTGITVTVFNLQITKRGEHKEANHIVLQGLQKETNLEILNDQSTENQKRCPEVDHMTPQGLQISDVQGLHDGHIQMTEIQAYHPSQKATNILTEVVTPVIPQGLQNGDIPGPQDTNNQMKKPSIFIQAQR